MLAYTNRKKQLAYTLQSMDVTIGKKRIANDCIQKIILLGSKISL